MKTIPKVILFIVVAMVLLSSSARFYTDFLWLRSVGHESVLVQTLLMQGASFLSAFLLAWLFFLLNLEALRRTFGIPPRPLDNIRYYPSEQPWQDQIKNYLAGRNVTWILRGIAALLAVLVALPAFSAGLPAILALNAELAGIADPLYGKDASFFMFHLPLLRSLTSGAFGVVLMTALAIVVIYLAAKKVDLARGGQPPAIKHLSLLTATLLAMQAYAYRLNSYELAYSPRGVAFGASFTDVFATRPILYVLMVIALLGAVIALANLKLLWTKILLLAPALIVAVSVLLGSIVPAVVQQYIVLPNELVRETPYIRHNIEFTRAAFGLNDITIKDLPAPAPFTAKHLANNAPTLTKTRLLDWQPLLSSYRQLQGIRVYYRFHDVDIDRYELGGELAQVMLAARELSLEDLNPAARTWINEHLRFTHGFGAVVSPVNRTGPRGEPLFYVQDIPPRAQRPELAIERPQIYFGEFTGGYVIVNAKTDEFSFPLGEENATHRYQGKDGVPLTPFNKLMFSLRYGTSMLLLSEDVQPQSRILFHRNIMERVRRIAPFLTYDPDPYLVISEGRLYWIIDAYTTSKNFPYATPHGQTGINYIRNSVKVVVDAYDGTVDFYQVDDADSVANTLRRAFPGLLRPLAEMPTGLHSHLRYPELLLSMQAQMLATYHMTSPSTFYNKEDVWRIAREQQRTESRPMLPYYLLMDLPADDEKRAEFVLVLPLTPAGTEANPKHNMVAYLAGRSDGENYGELLLYRFPKELLVQGPMQIEARINQDAEISPLLTLWGEGGSTVFRGNLLVLPIGDSLLYVQPLYIQAAGGSIPELKRVIVATDDKLEMAPTFAEALAAITGAKLDAVLPGIPAPPATGDGANLAELATAIEQAFRAAQNAARAGDWAKYGEHLAELERLIGELTRLRP